MPRRIKIGQRLGLGFAVIFAIFLSLTFFAINKMGYLSEQTLNIYRHPLVVSKAVLRINTNIIKIHREMKDVVLHEGLEAINEHKGIIDAQEREIYEDFKIVESRFLGSRELYEKSFAAFAEWKDIRDEVFSLMAKGRKKEAVRITKGQGARHVIKIEKAVEALGDFAENKATEFLYEAQRTRDVSFNTLYFLVAISLMLGIGFAVYLTSSITRPIESLKKAVSKVGKGQLDVEIDTLSNDELGELSALFNEMTMDLRRITTSRDELNKEVEARAMVEADLRDAELQFKTLYELSLMRDKPRAEIADFVLQKLIELTKSSIGFLGFMTDDESVFKIHAWSKHAMDNCAVMDAPIHFPIDKAGVWAEAVRKRGTLLINDYANTRENKSGLPEGHAPLERLLVFPVFDEGRVVAVATAGNKETEYDNNDVQQVDLLLNGMWNLIKRQDFQKQLQGSVAEKEALLQEVHLSEQFSRLLLNSTAEAIYGIDTEGNCIFVNPSCLTMLGYEKESDILGKNMHELIHHTKPDGSKYPIEDCFIFSAFRTGEDVRIDSEVLWKADGTSFNVEYWSRPMYTNNEITGAVVAFLDITERKAAENKIAASLEEKEVLLQEVHHRVKNNMAIIASFLELQTMMAGDDKVAQMFRETRQRIKSMALIHEKLYKTRDFKKIHLEGYVFKLVRELVESYEHLGAKVNPEIDVGDFQLDLTTLIPVGLIINELVTNSLKYAYKDTGTPEMEIKLAMDGDNRVQMVIADNGPGLPEDIAQLMGKSLGLKIVGSLVAQLHGTMDVTAEKGTRYQIDFTV